MARISWSFTHHFEGGGACYQESRQTEIARRIAGQLRMTGVTLGAHPFQSKEKRTCKIDLR